MELCGGEESRKGRGKNKLVYQEIWYYGMDDGWLSGSSGCETEGMCKYINYNNLFFALFKIKLVL